MGILSPFRLLYRVSGCVWWARKFGSGDDNDNVTVEGLLKALINSL